MECELVSKVPDGPQWTYEIKFDGYRAIAVNAGGKVTLFSRNRKSFNKQFAGVVHDLNELPDGCVLDGEVVGLDESGRPDFNLLQNYEEQASRIHYFVFDLLVCHNRDLTRLPLTERQALLRSLISFKSARIHIVEPLEGSAAAIIAAIRKLGLEGVIAKSRDSLYQPGERTGRWVKHRLNLSQEFVVGGFMPGGNGIEALIVGFYREGKLVYAASIRAGLVVNLRRRLFGKLAALKVAECPFINLPEKGKNRMGRRIDRREDAELRVGST
jgi:DNA ligase D-like protein (predicted ligase)